MRRQEKYAKQFPAFCFINVLLKEVGKLDFDECVSNTGILNGGRKKLKKYNSEYENDKDKNTNKKDV